MKIKTKNKQSGDSFGVFLVVIAAAILVFCIGLVIGSSTVSKEAIQHHAAHYIVDSTTGISSWIWDGSNTNR